MRLSLGSCLCLLVVLALPVAAQGVLPEEAKEGFQPLFDGKDFSGWQFGGGYGLPDPLPDNWKVEDGLIKLAGGGQPNLGSQWDYGDFEIRVEWRALKASYNSGFYIRSGRKVGSNQINLAKGSEGAFLGKLDGAKPVPSLQKPAGEWNEWRAIVVGDTVAFSCNGQEAWKATGIKPARGHVGFQAEGAVLEFRNLRIRELGWTNLNDPAAWTDAGATKQGYGEGTLRVEWRQAKAGGQGSVGLGGEKGPRVLLGAAGGSGGLKQPDAAPAKATDNPQGQWNYLEITRGGGLVKVWQNGEIVVTAASDAAPGPITFDRGGGGIEFRNGRVK